MQGNQTRIDEGNERALLYIILFNIMSHWSVGRARLLTAVQGATSTGKSSLAYVCPHNASLYLPPY
jgi:hypothetical protein